MEEGLFVLLLKEIDTFDCSFNEMNANSEEEWPTPIHVNFDLHYVLEISRNYISVSLKPAWMLIGAHLFLSFSRYSLIAV